MLAGPAMPIDSGFIVLRGSLAGPKLSSSFPNGGGMEASLLSDLVALQTWSHVAENLSEDLRWNLCYEIMHAHRAVKTEATRIVMQLFLEGRLKKRRRRNRSYVQVLAAAGV